MSYKRAADIAPPFVFGELGLRRRFLAPPQHKGIHRDVVSSADLSCEQHGLIETAPAQPLRCSGTGMIKSAGMR